MANTYTLISSNTLSSSAASVTFSSIPSTYTDLVLRVSARTDESAVKTTMKVNINNDTTSGNYSSTTLYTQNGTTVTSIRNNTATYLYPYYADGATATSNTFNSFELYIPSYTASQKKPLSASIAREDNTTAVDLGVVANLWQGTAAVSSLQLDANGTNFVSGSSFYLYGIKNS